MAKYRIEQTDVYDSFGDYKRRDYVIKKKHFLFGWCWKHSVSSLEELNRIIKNLEREQHAVYFHWSFTDNYKMILNCGYGTLDSKR